MKKDENILLIKKKLKESRDGFSLILPLVFLYIGMGGLSLRNELLTLILFMLFLIPILGGIATEILTRYFLKKKNYKGADFFSYFFYYVFSICLFFF